MAWVGDMEEREVFWIKSLYKHDADTRKQYPDDHLLATYKIAERLWLEFLGARKKNDLYDFNSRFVRDPCNCLYRYRKPQREAPSSTLEDKHQPSLIERVRRIVEEATGSLYFDRDPTAKVILVGLVGRLQAEKEFAHIRVAETMLSPEVDSKLPTVSLWLVNWPKIYYLPRQWMPGMEELCVSQQHDPPYVIPGDFDKFFSNYLYDGEERRHSLWSLLGRLNPNEEFEIHGVIATIPSQALAATYSYGTGLVIRRKFLNDNQWRDIGHRISRPKNAPACSSINLDVSKTVADKGYDMRNAKLRTKESTGWDLDGNILSLSDPQLKESIPSSRFDKEILAHKSILGFDGANLAHWRSMLRIALKSGDRKLKYYNAKHSSSDDPILTYGESNDSRWNTELNAAFRHSCTDDILVFDTATKHWVHWDILARKSFERIRLRWHLAGLTPDEIDAQILDELRIQELATGQKKA